MGRCAPLHIMWHRSRLQLHAGLFSLLRLPQSDVCASQLQHPHWQNMAAASNSTKAVAFSSVCSCWCMYLCVYLCVYLCACICAVCSGTMRPQRCQQKRQVPGRTSCWWQAQKAAAATLWRQTRAWCTACRPARDLRGHAWLWAERRTCSAGMGQPLSAALTHTSLPGGFWGEGDVDKLMLLLVKRYSPHQITRHHSKGQAPTPKGTSVVFVLLSQRRVLVT
jgi:hypothetical protein